jgi:hypothetical protein
MDVQPPLVEEGIPQKGIHVGAGKPNPIYESALPPHGGFFLICKLEIVLIMHSLENEIAVQSDFF